MRYRALVFALNQLVVDALQPAGKWGLCKGRGFKVADRAGVGPNEAVVEVWLADGVIRTATVDGITRAQKVCTIVGCAAKGELIDDDLQIFSRAARGGAVSKRRGDAARTKDVQ